MFAVIGLIAITLWIEAVGMAAIALLWRRSEEGSSILERIGLSYMIGLGGVVVLSFYWMFAGVRFRWWGIVIITIPLLAFGFFFTKKNRSKLKCSCRCSVPQLTLWLICACAVILPAFWMLALPLHGWDAIHLWAYKTEILSYHGEVWTEEYTDPEISNTPRTYPHFMPIAQLWHTLPTGPVLEARAWKLFYVLLQGAFVLVFYGAVRRRYPPGWALVFSTIAATAPHFINLEDGGPLSGYADVMLALYYFLAAAALWQWLAECDEKWLFIAAFATGLCYFTKREGILPVFLNTGAVLIFSTNWRRLKEWPRYTFIPAIKFILVMCAVVLPVFIFARAVEAEPDLVGMMLRDLTWERFMERSARLPVILATVGDYLFLNFRTWGIAWWLVVLLPFLSFKEARRPANLYLLLAILAPIVNFCIVATITTFDLQGLLLVTFTRAIILTTAPVILYIALMSRPFIVANSENETST